MRQKRAIFFVFDGGTGIGHLRRLGRIAGRLQEQVACLIVTGHRAAASWFVPAECEYVHLPSWDSLLANKSRYWGREPFLNLEFDEAARFRKAILAGIVDAFAPDAIFVDHLPLGLGEELADIVEGAPCLKYFVTRGVLNETENLRRLILGGPAGAALEKHYHRLLVAADPRVFDFARQYNVSAAIRQKTIHTGYVVEEVPRNVIERTRTERGLADGDVWVVASAGGGQLGEPLIEACVDLAGKRRDIAFDIVQGPRSKLAWNGRNDAAGGNGNARLHRESQHMPWLHAAADVVVSSGGYNSLLESLQGTAKIVCIPNRKDRRDEQYRHAARLRQFVDIELSPHLAALPALMERAIGARGTPDRRAELDLAGTAVIERIVRRDLGLGES
ncbi:glycosyltransferase [Actinoplanes sp. NPDC049265]|uniref:glycosyltransferase n=1 Tax=Actinoplanes sp. NPDC049265 TaxID=3363902 RepID=UPI00371804F2